MLKSLVRASALIAPLLTYGCACGVPPPEVIDLPTPTANLSAAPVSVTHGTQGEDLIEGRVNVTWTTTEAETLQLFLGETEIELPACVAAGECVDEGEADIIVTASGTLRLLAIAEEGCTADDPGDRCGLAEVEVEAFPPADATLNPKLQEVEAGTDVELDLEVTSATAAFVSLVQVVGGDRTLTPCTPANQGGRCTLELTPNNDGFLGTVRVPDINNPIALVVTATGRAEDGRGDLPDGKVEATIAVTGHPAIDGFDVDDTTVAPGGSVRLTWQTTDATGLSFSASPNVVDPASLAACHAGDVADGGCELRFSAEAPAGTVAISLVATRDDLRSAPFSRVITLGPLPELTLTATPDALPEGGGTVTLTWSAAGADRLVLRNDDANEVLHDTDDANCVGACDPEAGSVDVDLTLTSEIVAAATNDFGTASVSARVDVAGAPTVDSLFSGQNDLVADPTVYITPGEDLSLTWTTVNASSTELNAAPTDDGDCFDADLVFELVDHGEAASGTADIPQTDTAVCYRLTAIGSAEQRSSRTFLAVRAPDAPALTLDDNTVNRGQPFTLGFSVEHASSLEIEVSPLGALSNGAIDDCVRTAALPAGSCVFAIQAGAPQGAVTLTVRALGQLGAPSAQADIPLTVGEAPTALTFTANPETLAEAGDVELSWTTDEGAAVSVADESGERFSSTDAGVVAAGSVTLNVDATRTFIFTVTNEFGEDSLERTVFLGPAFATADGGGDDALDGLVETITGNLTVSWTTTNATAVALEDADVPVSGDCSEAATFTELFAGAADDSFEIVSLVNDRCLRLRATNDAAQESELRFLARDLPEITDLSASPGTLAATGGTILVQMSTRGVSALDLRVFYLDDQGEIIDDDLVCDEQSLNSGTLNDADTVDDTSCEDTYDNPNNVACLTPGVCRLTPNGTASLRYELDARDSEGDAAVADTSDGGDVTAE